MVRELFQRFEGKHGTSLCRDLLGADMSTEEGHKKIQQEGLISKICPGIGRDVARILEDLLSKEVSGSD